MVELDSFLRIDAMRHGESEYKQPYEMVGIEETDDLTPEGEENVINTSSELANLVLRELDQHPNLQVDLISSPYGRALHSARIVSDVFTTKGIPLREDVARGVEILDDLGMVGGGFRWKHFSPLAKGGEVELDGRTFYIDSARTNPRELGAFEYFFRDGIGQMSSETRASLPTVYLQLIDGFEKAIDCAKRFMACVTSYARRQIPSPRHSVFITHSESLYYPANVFTRGQINLVDSGSFVSFDRLNDRRLVVTQVGSLTQGRSDVDIVQAFETDYPLMRDGQRPVYYR